MQEKRLKYFLHIEDGIDLEFVIDSLTKHYQTGWNRTLDWSKEPIHSAPSKVLRMRQNVYFWRIKMLGRKRSINMNEHR